MINQTESSHQRKDHVETRDKENTPEIDLSELNIGNVIACGAQAKIFRGIFEGRDVAIKFMTIPIHHDELETSSSTSSIQQQQQFRESDQALTSLVKQQFTSEVAILSRLHHPNVVQYIASCEKATVFLILTEYMSKGNLREFLDKQKRCSLSTNTIVRLALEISRGMEYIHSQGFVHRDLKSSNLLLNNDMEVKVADFGTSCLETQCKGSKGHLGTYRWMAPEMLKGKRYSRKVDVYSFGMVLWELATTLLPFEGLNPLQAAFAVSDKNKRPTLPETCHPGIADLITRCWAADPSKRPEFSEIVPVLEKYSECVSNGLPLPFRSERYTGGHKNILEYVCLIGSSIAVHP